MDTNNGKVNYLLEINAFYRWLENHPLSSGAIALWHALMQQWNLSFWEDEFTPALEILCLRSGLSKSSVYRAREELRNAELLQYSQRKKQATKYELVCFNSQIGNIYKQNKTKLNNTKHDPMAVVRNREGFLVPAGIAALEERSFAESKKKRSF